MSNLKRKVFDIVNQIPEQKVTNFGEIAKVVGSDARTVGFILSGMNEDEMRMIPWYRVVAKDGFISSLKLGAKGMLQKEILLRKGYILEGDNVDMQRHLWLPYSDEQAEVLF